MEFEEQPKTKKKFDFYKKIWYNIYIKNKKGIENYDYDKRQNDYRIKESRYS